WRPIEPRTPGSGESGNPSEFKYYVRSSGTSRGGLRKWLSGWEPRPEAALYRSRRGAARELDIGVRLAKGAVQDGRLSESFCVSPGLPLQPPPGGPPGRASTDQHVPLPGDRPGRYDLVLPD